MKFLLKIQDVDCVLNLAGAGICFKTEQPTMGLASNIFKLLNKFNLMQIEATAHSQACFLT
jgi:hypothetical protein